MDITKLVKLLHEIGSLKNTPRSGWLKIGIKNPESVAEHSFRTAIIAFFVAFLETKDIDKACKASFLALIHDLPESRTLDLHNLAKKYVKTDPTILEQQLEPVYEEIRMVGNETKKFVKDADKLELLFQAKEYSEFTESALIYTENLKFECKTAEKIAEVCRKTDHRWWIEFE